MKFRILFLLYILICNLVQAQDPDPPTITHLSVDSLSQQVRIHWYNNAPQAVGYIIYFQDAAGLWIPLDTVNGQQNYSYLTQGSNSQFQQETYSVVAFDAFGNTSTRSEAHSTLYLKYTYALCDSICQLKWDLYPEMLNQLGFKLVVRQKDLIDSSSEIIDEVLLSNFDSLYNFPVDYSSKYTFTLQAYNTLDSISRSNRFSITTTQVISPTYAYINKVDVNHENYIEVSVLSDSYFVDYFEVYRSSYDGGFFQFIGNVDVLENEKSGVFTDNMVLPDQNIYHYKVKAFDICGKRYTLPSFPYTIEEVEVHHLKLHALSLQPSEMQIDWIDYPFFLEEESYSLWLDVNGNLEQIRPINPNSYGSIDISDKVGLICAFVIVHEIKENALGLQDTVRSNRLCLTKEPTIFFPSAFTPSNGDIKNNIWSPLIVGLESIQSYSLQIYNRWGIKIHEIETPTGFWDGYYNGNVSDPGVYNFHLNFTFGNGEKVTRQGTITLIR